MTPRTFPSTVISPMVTANPVTVVSISQKGISYPVTPSKAVLIPQPTAISPSHTKPPSVTIIKTEACQKPSMTALEVLNDTIVKSFDAPNVENGLSIKREQSSVIASDFPLNLIKSSASNETVNVKRIENTSSDMDINHKDDHGALPGNQNPPKQFIVHVGKNGSTPNHRNSVSQTEIKPIGNFGQNGCFLSPVHQDSVIIKCEPDFSIVECKSPLEKKLSVHPINQPEIRPIENASFRQNTFSSCIASRISNIPCSKVSKANFTILGNYGKNHIQLKSNLIHTF